MNEENCIFKRIFEWNKLGWAGTHLKFNNSFNFKKSLNQINLSIYLIFEWNETSWVEHGDSLDQTILLIWRNLRIEINLWISLIFGLNESLIKETSWVEQRHFLNEKIFWYQQICESNKSLNFFNLWIKLIFEWKTSWVELGNCLN